MRPKTRIAVPNANGLDSANAQGQAIINTAVNAFNDDNITLDDLNKLIDNTCNSLNDTNSTNTEKKESLITALRFVDVAPSNVAASSARPGQLRVQTHDRSHSVSRPVPVLRLPSRDSRRSFKP